MIDLPDLRGLIALRVGLGIAHHIPGRIRLRLGAELLDRTRERRLDPGETLARLSLLPGVTGTRLNLQAASLVVEYDPGRIVPDWWETLILGDDDEALGIVFRLIGGL